MKSVVLKPWEVRAILEDRKTTIRRVVKGDIPSDAKFGYTNFTPEGCISCIGTWGGLKRNVFIKYPYSPGKGYRNGEAIYVREGFRLVDFSYIDGDWSATVEYNADYGYGPRLHYLKNGADEKIGWRPPVNMPLEAARMFLRVIDVRVERLHEITMDGMLAEGVIPNDVKGGQQDLLRLLVMSLPHHSHFPSGAKRGRRNVVLSTPYTACASDRFISGLRFSISILRVTLIIGVRNAVLDGHVAVVAVSVVEHGRPPLVRADLSSALRTPHFFSSSQQSGQRTRSDSRIILSNASRPCLSMKHFEQKFVSHRSQPHIYPFLSFSSSHFISTPQRSQV